MTPTGRAASDDPSVAAALYGLLTALLRRTSRDLSLTALATLGTLSRSRPQRLTDLARVEGITQPSMTALVTTLERLGYVERRADPGDGRVSLVSITARGRAYLRRRRAQGTAAFAELIDRLPARERASLEGAVGALAHLGEIDHEERARRGER